MFDKNKFYTRSELLDLVVKIMKEDTNHIKNIAACAHKINNITMMINIRLSLINKELDQVSMWNPWKFKRLLKESDLLFAWIKFLFDLQATLGI